jgi:hypothetical protein
MTTVRRVLHEKRRLIWPLALVLAANIAVFAIVVYPLSQKVAMGQQQADAANIALVNARRDTPTPVAPSPASRRPTRS